MMNHLYDQLRDLGSAAVSDALDSFGMEGGLVGLTPRVPGTAICGPAFTVRYEPLDAHRQHGFMQAGNYIDEVPAGAVIVVDNDGRADATTWGNILTEVARQRKIAGTLIHGAARDVARIRELTYPLFSQHVFMQSGKNRVVKVAHQSPITIAGRNIFPNDIIVADDDGCVVVPQKMAVEVAARAQRIQATEAAILDAVATGASLAAARETHGYATPWKERPQ